jgi:hypothetical protein
MNVENSGIFDVLVLPLTALDLDQEAINVFTFPEIRGMIARFLKGFFSLIKRFSFDLVPQRR